MSMEIRKIAAAGLFGLAAYAMTGTASAQTTTCNAASSGTWDCVQYQDGTSTTYINAPDNVWFGPSGDDTTSFHFEGDSVLSYSFFGADCGLNIDGQLKYDESADTIQIRVTDAEAVAGDSLCNQIYLEGFPWTSDVITNDVHTPTGGSTSGTLNDVVISLFSMGSETCTGDLSNVQFRNGDPITAASFFTFDGSIGACSVEGDVYSEDDADVNAY
ncbi:MAG: hypothetical protein ACJATD_001473 [Alloalcanivorax sp.]|jgi:hypothetical protein